MNKIITYIKECYNELMNKVSWPPWNELQSSAIVVLTASFIIGIIVFILDTTFQGAMNLIYSLFD